MAFKENCFIALNLSTLKYIVGKDAPLLLPPISIHNFNVALQLSPWEKESLSPV